MTLIMNAVTQPARLYWWQWGKILGLALPALLYALGVEHLLLWALAIHFLTDFSTQSHETAVRKARGDRWVQVYHAFISGGYPGLVVGGLPGVVISVASHFIVDRTNKFGLEEPTGPVLDQAAHLITLAAIWWLL